MAKARTILRCSECGATTPKWTGRCPLCECWNSLEEEVEVVAQAGGNVLELVRPADRAEPICDVDATAGAPVPTGLGELDRVLGGGLVPGSVTLVHGEPGIGKSTLLLDVMARLARARRPVLYVSGEESKQQVRSRAARMNALEPLLWLQAEHLLPHILATVDEIEPEVLVIDSIQTMVEPELGSAPGSMVQVRECAHRLVREAKQRNVAVLLVGHVTKDGGLAGPRVLEHVVDTVLAFEGDQHHALRMLRAVKHRFGPTSELGLFEMTDLGLAAVPDPSALFLADRRKGLSGSAVVAMIEGQRPLLVEVQALVADSSLSVPRRSAQGLDQGRLGMLLAVVEQRAGLKFSGLDVFASVVGGVRLGERGPDLGTCLALVSSLHDRAVPEDLVSIGEVGLGGELRQVAQTPRRLAEAARLGFRHALVPSSAPTGVDGIKVIRAATLVEALRAVALL
jgi:DNA repair protein RadA/Sms